MIPIAWRDHGYSPSDDRALVLYRVLLGFGFILVNMASDRLMSNMKKTGYLKGNERVYNGYYVIPVVPWDGKRA